MLPLNSPRWSELRHAYGSAGDIPALLKQLEGFPSSENNGEPWFALWSSLCHQGDVYPASFAAVPHIIGVLAMAPERADFSFFHLPAQIEIRRLRTNALVPDELREAYFSALRQIPVLVAAASARKWNNGFMTCALSAIAAAKGFPIEAEAIQELNPENAQKLLNDL